MTISEIEYNKTGHMTAIERQLKDKGIQFNYLTPFTGKYNLVINAIMFLTRFIYSSEVQQAEVIYTQRRE